MSSVLSAQQVAFDAAVKAQSNFLYPGIADLGELRERDATVAPFVDQLIEIRNSFNAALAVEGQDITGDAPHAPFHFDYIDSVASNALAFKDPNHSFIGVTIPLVIDVLMISRRLAADDGVVAGIGLVGVDRAMLEGALFWILLGFVVSHEYAHHTHGHWASVGDARPHLTRLRRQARELDADGWAAYLTLNQWVLAGGRQTLLQLLELEAASAAVQDDVLIAAFFVAQAAFTFIREPEPIDRHRAYGQTHPPQPVRLHMMSRFVLKFVGEFRPGVRDTLTEARYQDLMDQVARLMWANGKHADTWAQQTEFLRTTDGSAYVQELVNELDVFRATLRKWEAEVRRGESTTAGSNR